jgi:Ras-related protein Rab-1A
VDYKAKEIGIDKETVKLQIWDTAGQERFRSMTAAFYSRAQGIIITFDVGLRHSFDALTSWIKEIHEATSCYFSSLNVACFIHICML